MIKANSYLDSWHDEDVCESAVAPFVKTEVMMGRGPQADGPPVKPRMIQAYATNATAYKFGQEFYSMQKALAATFNGEPIVIDGVEFRLTYTGGLNGDDLAAWAEALNPTWTFYERDGKNWDATMQAMHIEWALSAYSLVCPELAEFANSCRVVRGVFFDRKANIRVKYKAKDTRKSGHNDTSSGNTLINFGILVDSILSLPYAQRPTVVAAVAMGDDLLAAGDFRPGFEDLMSGFESALGIVPEARAFDNIFDVTFISGRWYPAIGGGYVFGPILGRMLAKLFWSTSQLARTKPHAWASTVAEAFMPFFGNAVGLRSWLLRHMTTNERVKHDKMHYHLEGTKSIDWDFYFPYFYGMGLADQVDFAYFVESIPRRQYTLIDHPFTTQVMEVDCEGVLERPTHRRL